MSLPIRSPDEIESIARAGASARRVLDELISHCVPGVTTAALDDVARDAMAREGVTGVSGYVERRGQPGFRGAICVNINEEAAHGVPSPRRVREGDLVSIDVAVQRDGWWADMSAPVVAGGPDGRGARLRDAARRATRAGVEAMGPGVRWQQVVQAIRGTLAEVRLVDGLGGHGVGRGLHEPPSLGYGSSDLVLRPGMVVTLEPTVTDGQGRTTMLDNGWTLVTVDRGWTCFRECTVAVVRGGIRVLAGD